MSCQPSTSSLADEADVAGLVRGFESRREGCHDVQRRGGCFFLFERRELERPRLPMAGKFGLKLAAEPAENKDWFQREAATRRDLRIGPPTRRPLSFCEGELDLALESAAQLVERDRVGLVALEPECLLEVRDQSVAKREIGLRPGDDVVELRRGRAGAPGPLPPRPAARAGGP